MSDYNLALWIDVLSHYPDEYDASWRAWRKKLIKAFILVCLYEVMKLVTFNNLIPSHSMKFILWHDVDESEGEVQDEGQYSEEDEDVEEVEDVQPVAI